MKDRSPRRLVEDVAPRIASRMMSKKGGRLTRAGAAYLLSTATVLLTIGLEYGAPGTMAYAASAISRLASYSGLFHAPGMGAAIVAPALVLG